VPAAAGKKGKAAVPVTQPVSKAKEAVAKKGKPAAEHAPVPAPAAAAGKKPKGGGTVLKLATAVPNAGKAAMASSQI
jgi:hypothetical protein